MTLFYLTNENINTFIVLSRHASAQHRQSQAQNWRKLWDFCVPLLWNGRSRMQIKRRLLPELPAYPANDQWHQVWTRFCRFLDENRSLFCRRFVKLEAYYSLEKNIRADNTNIPPLNFVLCFLIIASSWRCAERQRNADTSAYKLSSIKVNLYSNIRNVRCKTKSGPCTGRQQS